MEPIQELNEYLCYLVETPGDINEHLFTLCDYAKQSEVVGELGVRTGTSTAALALGLLRNGKSRQQLISVDRMDCSAVVALRLAQASGLDSRFIQADSATVILPEVDLLFIDSWHCYGHLKRELAAHQHRVRKWMIMHDTTAYSRTSDSVSMGEDLILLSEQSGYSIEEIYKGLSFAVEEFLSINPEWTIERVHHHNNGLTILKRSTWAFTA
jgi:hypothetical protein